MRRRSEDVLYRGDRPGLRTHGACLRRSTDIERLHRSHEDLGEPIEQFTVKIQNDVSVYEGVELEDSVFCGPSMVFTNVFNPRSEVVRKDEYRKTLVKKGASIGANATVVCGSTIGEYAFVGAGSVVTKDVPAYALVMGNPARRTAWMCRCGEKLGKAAAGETLACPSCQARYDVAADRISPRS